MYCIPKTLYEKLINASTINTNPSQTVRNVHNVKNIINSETPNRVLNGETTRELNEEATHVVNTHDEPIQTSSFSSSSPSAREEHIQPAPTHDHHNQNSSFSSSPPVQMIVTPPVPPAINVQFDKANTIGASAKSHDDLLEKGRRKRKINGSPKRAIDATPVNRNADVDNKKSRPLIPVLTPQTAIKESGTYTSQAQKQVDAFPLQSSNNQIVPYTPHQQKQKKTDAFPLQTGSPGTQLQLSHHSPSETIIPSQPRALTHYSPSPSETIIPSQPHALTHQVENVDNNYELQPVAVSSNEIAPLHNTQLPPVIYNSNRLPLSTNAPIRPLMYDIPIAANQQALEQPLHNTQLQPVI